MLIVDALMDGIGETPMATIVVVTTTGCDWGTDSRLLNRCWVDKVDGVMVVS